jgi:2-polyprenyl-3-methyl-5-hydroxy-6-metoxy-1,4-benzoquinol methylase
MQEFDKNEGESASAAQRMKDDWNARALENAKWYINTVGVTQSDEEFFRTGEQEVLKWWLPDFRASLFGKDLKALRVFEMGCGIGRMTVHLAAVFGEVWALDVSGEMIEQARMRFAHLKMCAGWRLRE